MKFVTTFYYRYLNTWLCEGRSQIQVTGFPTAGTGPIQREKVSDKCVWNE